MKLVNAGLKSEVEFAQRMINGEVFYESGDKHHFFDGSFKMNSFDDGGCNLHRYAKMQKQPEWYESIDKPVPCWVWDDPTDDKVIVLINRYDTDNEPSFGEYISGIYWNNAEPLTLSDILEGFENAS